MSDNHSRAYNVPKTKRNHARDVIYERIEAINAQPRFQDFPIRNIGQGRPPVVNIEKLYEGGTRHIKIYRRNKAGISRGINHFYLFFGYAPVFSNFYPCTFTLNGNEFSSSEQCYHYLKALWAGERQIANNILCTNDPHLTKKIARTIPNFDRQAWEEDAAEEKMLDAVYAKFSQNSDLCAELLSTDDATIIEASPFDKRWGIGMAYDDDKALIESNWPNRNRYQTTNLLGEVLMIVRRQLREDSKEVSLKTTEQFKTKKSRKIKKHRNRRETKSMNWLESSMTTNDNVNETTKSPSPYEKYQPTAIRSSKSKP